MKFIETTIFAESFGLKVSRVDWWIRHGHIEPKYIRQCGRKFLIRTDTPIPDLKPGRKKACSNG